MTTASITLPSRRRDRLLARPSIRAVLAVFSVLAPFALALWLSEAVPKPWPANWPLLLAAAGIVAGYWLYVRRIEKREVAEVSATGAWRELGSGLGLGALLVAACTLVLLATGAYTITGTVLPSVMLKPLGEQIMVAFFEEILFRAVMFRLLEKSWGTRIALTVSTLLFVLAHLPSEHFSVLAAVMTGTAARALTGAYLLTRRLWLPIGMHFAWNYLFDAVISVPVSGHAARGWIQVRVSGPEWLNGGTYGIEASVVTFVAWGIATVALLTLAKRRGQWT